MKTIDISGMGGGYEHVCQRMLANGRKYLAEHPDFSKELGYRQYEGVTGICLATTIGAKNFNQIIMFGIEDATGAMHQAVVGHLLYIAKNGEEKWLEIFKDDPDRIYEWDGTDKTVPVTELSKSMDSHR